MVNMDCYTYSHEMKPGYYAIGQSVGNVEIEKRILHDGEVIKTRYMPQDPNIIATKTNNGEVHLFNINLSYNGDKTSPELRLKGHNKKGLGLDWNTLRKG
jgi:histone-binding protein RBBP4